SGELAGAKLLVSTEGIVAGSILPELDDTIAADALDLLANERSELRLYSPLTQERSDGSSPLATLEVFIETFPPPQRLIIIAGVHVAIPLHRIAKLLGYHVTIIDARGVLATPERFPQADSILVQWPDEALPSLAP